MYKNRSWVLQLTVFHFIYFCTVMAYGPLVQEWNIERSIPLTWKELQDGNSPGLKVRITRKGFNYATTKAINVLSRSVRGMTIPDQHGKSGDIEYGLSSMKVQSLSKSRSDISPASYGLQWTANGVGMTAKGNWKYEYKNASKKISDHGSFDINISGVNFRLGIIIDVDYAGQPRIRTSSCSDIIGGVSVKFQGGATWVNDRIKKPISNYIQQSMKIQMCRVLSKVINENAERELLQLKLRRYIAQKFLLDYRIIANPRFTYSYMETIHRGKVTWEGSNGTVPFSVPPLSPYSGTSRMFYIWISDYVFNSMTYAAHVHGFLKYNLTKKDLPQDQRRELNTRCIGSVCIGNFIIQLQRSYPNSTVQLRLSTSASPHVNISSKNISVQSNGTIMLDVQLPNNTFVCSLVTLNASMAATIKVSVGNRRIYAKVMDMPIKANVDKENSKIKDISDTAINFITNSVVREVLRPILDNLGSNGFPLPVTQKVKFQSPSIVMGQNTLLIATDIVYG